MNLVTVIDASPPDAMVRVGGELDIFSAHELSRRMTTSVDDGCRRILLDLSGVRFVDAGALRVLDRFRSQVAAAGGTLRIVSSSPQFHQRCRMAGLDASFELADPQPA